VNGYVNAIGVSGERLVNRVVHHLVHKVMQTHFASRTDVHRRAQPHGLQAFQRLNIFSGVFAVAAVAFLRFRLFFGAQFSFHLRPGSCCFLQRTPLDSRQELTLQITPGMRAKCVGKRLIIQGFIAF
jgi:hypothetical protein